MLKIGLGYDLHRLVYGRPLVLGGVKLPGSFGTQAHSDGDALVHAVIDSLTTPCGLPDIGQLFPDTDPAYQNADSIALLKQVREKYLGGVTVQNMDCVLILEAPKLSPFKAEMAANIAAALEIEPSRVGIKAKTTENTSLYTVECYVTVLLESRV